MLFPIRGTSAHLQALGLGWMYLAVEIRERPGVARTRSGSISADRSVEGREGEAGFSHGCCACLKSPSEREWTLWKCLHFPVEGFLGVSLSGESRGDDGPVAAGDVCGRGRSAGTNFLSISSVSGCLFSDMSHSKCILARVLYICR